MIVKHFLQEMLKCPVFYVCTGQTSQHLFHVLLNCLHYLLAFFSDVNDENGQDSNRKVQTMIENCFCLPAYSEKICSYKL